MRTRGRCSRKRLAGVAVVVAACVLAGCGSDGNDLTITVDEWSLRAEPGVTDSGTVSMNVDNLGQTDHQLVLAAAPEKGALATLPSGAVDLAKSAAVDQLDSFGPGRFEASFIRILPGKYVLFCNLVTGGVAHYARGMSTMLEIEATKSDEPAG